MTAKNWRKWLLELFLNHTIWFILVVMLVVSGILLPQVFSGRIVGNVMRHAVFIGILAIGQTFCLLTGNFDMSVASTLEVSGIVGAMLIGSGGSAWGIGLNPVLTVAIMLAIGATIGLINSVIVVDLGINSFIGTFATMMVFHGVAVLVSGSQAVMYLPAGFRAVSTVNLGPLPIMVWLMLALYLAFSFATRKTRFGRHLYAVGGSREASFKFGVNVTGTIRTAYVISGVLAAIAAWLLISRMNAATPLMGENMLFEVVAAAVIGGISLQGGQGRLIGVLAGVLLLSLINSVLNITAVSVFYVKLIRGGLILTAVVIDTLKTRYYRTRT